MKVLAINGSARKNGNTSILIQCILQNLNKADVETEVINLAENPIYPCKACFLCADKGNCIFHTDHFREIFEKMKQADGLILGSPVYAANISANMQALLERSAVICDMNEDLLKHKVGASIVTARRGGALNAFDGLNHFFLNHEMIVVGSTYWNMAYKEAIRDKEALSNIDNLAQNMTWLLKKINTKDTDHEK